MDALSGNVTVMANTRPLSGMFSTAFAHKKKTMAAVYDDGTICLYDAGAGTSQILDLPYSQNEIFTVGYDKEDRYFIVLTSVGRLDIYDAETFEMLFSDSPTVLKNWSREYVNSDVSLNRLEAVDIASGAYLDVTAANNSDSYMILIDLASKTIAGEIDNAVGYDTETDRVFTSLKRGKVVSYPVYDLASLKEEAAKRLAARLLR